MIKALTNALELLRPPTGQLWISGFSIELSVTHCAFLGYSHRRLW
jgi:hypothetical protein